MLFSQQVFLVAGLSRSGVSAAEFPRRKSVCI